MDMPLLTGGTMLALYNVYHSLILVAAISMRAGAHLSSMALTLVPRSIIFSPYSSARIVEGSKIVPSVLPGAVTAMYSLAKTKFA